MSVQCPHCGGEFNLEVKLTANVIPSCTPRFVPSATPTQVAAPAKEPKFAVHTDGGKLRRAMYGAGFHTKACRSRIFNDKRTGVYARRLKVWIDLSMASPESLITLRANIEREFGWRLGQVAIDSTSILVYLLWDPE
jgi:hypothetical protein